jgi:hypothetical protein
MMDAERIRRLQAQMIIWPPVARIGIETRTAAARHRIVKAAAMKDRAMSYGIS